jgi:hypothetical protein
MSRVAGKQPKGEPTHDPRARAFKVADQKIENLLKRLNDKNVCPCCTARALALHAASMAEHTRGTAEAVEMFEEFISQMRERDVPEPEPMPSTEVH